MDFREVSAQTILRPFGAILEAQLVVDPGIDGTVSVVLENVTVRTVLDAVCESLGCEWRLEETAEDRTLYFTPAADGGGSGAAAPGLEERLAQRIDLSFAGAAPIDVLNGFAKLLRVDLELDCDVAQSAVTLELEKETVADALARVCDEVACDCSVAPGVLAVAER